MNKILIQFAHPAKSRSKINIALRKAVEGMENVTINDLYANYPDFLIDVKREQQLCADHDIIIFQHPLYWYSAPSIIKEWEDLVLEHSWAYGSKGKALEGKMYLHALTAGGSPETYEPEGRNKFTINELLVPYRAMTNLCGMTWLPPFTVMGIHNGLPDDQVTFHSDNYKRLITALRDGEMNLEKVGQMDFINSDLDALVYPSSVMWKRSWL